MTDGSRAFLQLIQGSVSQSTHHYVHILSAYAVLRVHAEATTVCTCLQNIL